MSPSCHPRPNIHLHIRTSYPFQFTRSSSATPKLIFTNTISCISITPGQNCASIFLRALFFLVGYIPQYPITHHRRLFLYLSCSCSCCCCCCCFFFSYPLAVMYMAMYVCMYVCFKNALQSSTSAAIGGGIGTSIFFFLGVWVACPSARAACGLHWI
jgi:hypothetical protein